MRIPPLELVIEPKPGTYALIISCASVARIQVGRLGTMQLQGGYYVYLGSALGPGGLRARIAHHQKLSTRPHWHIDYLRPHARLHSVWLRYDGRRREHEWARAVKSMKGATIPLLRFGASDCDCPSHLYFFERCPCIRFWNSICRQMNSGVVSLPQSRCDRQGTTIDSASARRQMAPKPCDSSSHLSPWTGTVHASITPALGQEV